MKKYSGFFWAVGLCAFVALFCSGLSWLLGVIGATWSFLGTLKSIANLILSVAAFIAGWLWLCSTKMNKTLKIVLQVFFVVFAILAVCGCIQAF